MESSTGQIKLPSTLDLGTTVPIAITGWEQSGICNTPQHNINLSVPRQGDHNELLAKVAKRAERAQLLIADCVSPRISARVSPRSLTVYCLGSLLVYRLDLCSCIASIADCVSPRSPTVHRCITRCVYSRSRGYVSVPR